jgi:polar amino acid transport system permease protein
LLRAFGSSIVITLEAGAAAIVLGGIVAALLGRSGFAGRATSGLSDFVRKTPILVQLYFVYFVLPDVGVVLSAWITGVLTLALHYSFYIAEVYRAGIAAIPIGQTEAAKALGLRRTVTFAKIILPQSLPIIVPNTGNYVIYMLKDTPYLSAISVIEVMRVSYRLGGDFFRYIEPLTITGLLFLAASWCFALATSLLERRLRGRWARRSI